MKIAIILVVCFVAAVYSYPVEGNHFWCFDLYLL